MKYNHKTQSKQHYLTILETVYPGIDVQHVEKFNGYDSVVLIINKDRLFKFPQRKEVISQYHLEDKLFPIIEHLTNINTPKIIEIKNKNQGIDTFVAEYKVMKGNHLTLEIKKNNFTHSDYKDIGAQIGMSLSQLHSIDTQYLHDLGVPEFNSRKWHEEYEFIQNNCLHLLNEEQQAWVNHLYTHFLKIWDMQLFDPVLIHGDLGNWHIFAEKSNITGFIDWGDVRIDDPAYDIKWHESSNDYDAIIGEALLHEYKKKHEIDPYFFERTYFYKNRAPIAKFINGVKFNDEQRIKDGYTLLEEVMKN